MLDHPVGAVCLTSGAILCHPSRLIRAIEFQTQFVFELVFDEVCDILSVLTMHNTLSAPP